jgi:hypothetical protein
MANVLKMAKVHSIQVLHARGWSRRRIARELGIHRVARAVPDVDATCRRTGGVADVWPVPVRFHRPSRAGLWRPKRRAIDQWIRRKARGVGGS